MKRVLKAHPLYAAARTDTTPAEWALVSPKTEAARRQVRLGAVVVARLQEHRLRQAEERLALGTSWDSTWNLVFPNQVGRPFAASNLRRRSFLPLLESAGLPRIRFHDLRHTCATLYLRRQVPVKVVSEMLGHRDVVITLNTYAHVLPDMQEQAATVADLMFG